MIDNYEHIKKIMSFDSDDEFYYLEIIQRKKYTPNLRKSNVILNKYYNYKASNVYNVERMRESQSQQ